MSRKPHQPAELGDTAGPMPAGHAITVAGEQETKAIEAEMAFEAARAIGQMQAMQFTRDIADLSTVQIFLNLKNNKAYKALTIKDADGKPRRVADLEEFCEHFLGKSARRMQELASNYHLLGPQLYETAERIGFRNQDYRALKALPADDQEVIRQAMNPDADRDQVLDLLQELAVRHASEKAALTAKTKEAEDTADDRDRVIGTKQGQISALELKVASAERRQADFTDIETRDYECAPLHQALSMAMLELDKMAREVAHLTQVVGGQLMRDECLHALAMVAQRAVNISETYHLPINRAELLSDYSELDLRAAGLKPEALQ